MGTKIATLGAGCFWCIEAVFDMMEGVEKVVPGFAGGHIKNPAYREVRTGRTGHAEVVQITYNPDLISFDELLEVFFAVHDPTTLNRQGADIGTQYRSVIYFNNEEEKAVAEKTIGETNTWSDPIVTEVSPLTNFFLAEQDHHNYYVNNPEEGYCRAVVRPKVEKFKTLFRHKLKRN